jgi:DNA-binding MarR family transcriptional regulator
MSDFAALFSVEAYRMEDSVGYLLSRARAKLAKSLDTALLAHDITHAQAGILLMLASGRYDTAADLVREIYTDAASMTRMLDRLQKRGLLERTPHADDRRQVRLQLTDQGRSLATRLPPILTEVLNVQFSGFSPEEIGFLKSLLRKMLQAGAQAEPGRLSPPGA